MLKKSVSGLVLNSTHSVYGGLARKNSAKIFPHFVLQSQAMEPPPGSPVYEVLQPVASLEDEIEDYEYDDDVRDADYVPGSSDSGSDSDADFIPVGLHVLKPSCKTPPIPLIPPSECALPHVPPAESALPPVPYAECASSSRSHSHDSESNKTSGKRTKVDKKHYCVFCSKPQAKLQRHLLSAHKTETELIPLLIATGKDKKKELAKLRNAGDHLHNLEVLKEGQGNLVVKRKTNKAAENGDFVPCHKCLGYFFKRDLWRHNCPKKDDQECRVSKRKQLQMGRLLIPEKGYEDGIGVILESLRNDHISLVIKNDEVIKLLCKREFAKNGHDPDRYPYIRNKLREVGRLVIELRKVSNRENAGLKDFINSQQFQNLILATRNIAGFNATEKAYVTPSLALKIGHTMNRCSVLLKARAIERKDQILRAECEAFEELYRIKWEEEISSQAVRTLYSKKKNSSNNMPLLEDVRKLTTYLKDKAENLKSNLTGDAPIDSSTWTRLAETTLCQIILFNRRRQGEASKMKVEDYTNGIKSSCHNVDVLAGLSKLEQSLCKLFTRIEVTGKRGRTVPVILTHGMKDSIDTLLKVREKVGIDKGNPFLFARAHCNSQGHIRGSDTLRTVAHQDDIGLSKPEALRSTILRKHLAAMTQLVNLQDNELDIVAQYMGHDIRVHREYYRLPTATVQVAKVAKLLVAMGGEDSRDNDDTSGSDSDDVSSVTQEMPAGNQERSSRKRKGPLDDDLSIQSELTGSSTGTPTVLAKQTSSRKSAPSNLEELDEDISGTRRVHRNMQGRKKWLDEEVTACLKSFRRHIALSTLPGKAEILREQEKDETLQGRTWVQIKNFIRNHIKKSM